MHNIEFDGIIHLGAGNCEELPVYTERNASFVVWAEANPNKWQGLHEGLRSLPNQYLCRAAITDKDGETIPFHIYNHAEASSIYAVGKDLSKWYPDHKVIETVQVPTITVDSMLAKFGFDVNRISFMSLDVQGAELLALRGAKQVLSSPSLKHIYMEVVWADFYEGGCLQSELTEALAAFGFKLARIDKSVHKAYDPSVQARIDRGEYPEVAQADVLYEKGK